MRRKSAATPAPRSWWLLRHRGIAACLAIVGVIIALIPPASYRPAPTEKMQYGVTFSARMIRDMGLNWQDAYGAILDELRVRRLRIPVYWDDVEYKDDTYYWNDIDWQLEQARKRNVQVILAIGSRTPRWPECHLPGWAKELGIRARRDALLEHVAETVNRYKYNETVMYWQVENEPFLPLFGECPSIDGDVLDQEIALVRSLDDTRPIMLTDSGELSIWLPAARRADIFGTSLYLRTFSHYLNSYIHYPITPGFFRFKRNLTEFILGPDKPQEMIISELQAEPWGQQPYYSLTKAERNRTMDLEQMRRIVDFASKTGFTTAYLWGVEWWYWEKQVNNDHSYWEYAKTLFQ